MAKKKNKTIEDSIRESIEKSKEKTNSVIEENKKKIKVDNLLYSDYDKLKDDVKIIQKKKEEDKAKKKNIRTIYKIENEKAQKKMDRNMKYILENDKKRLEAEEYERNREHTDFEKAVEAVTEAYEHKHSKLPIITGIIIGIILPVIAIFGIFSMNKQQKMDSAMTECKSIVGNSRLDYISKGYIQYKDQINEKIKNNEPMDDKNISVKIERFANICEVALDIPENSIYYFYSIVGIGK